MAVENFRASTTAWSGGTTRTILVIEDNPTTRDVVRLTLGIEGFNVVEVSSGREAIEMATRLAPDLILQDMLLPDIDGFELVGQLRLLPQLADVPIIAFSGLLSRDDYGRASRLGFTDFLPKPVEPSWLLQVIQSHLGPQALTHETLRIPGLSASIAAVDHAIGRAHDSVEPETAEQRVLRRLEYQAAMNAAFAQRSAMHASMLAVIAGISQTLTRHLHLDDALSDVLASLLDASCVSRGALFMRGVGDSNKLALATTNGFSDALVADLGELCGQPELFDTVATSKFPLAAGLADDEPGARDLLARLGGTSALLVPFVADQTCLGMLLLVSTSRDLLEPDWVPFARSMKVHIGQALALSRTMSRLTASEARYRRIIETTNEGVWVLDAKFKTTFLNARMAQMLGYDPHEIIGRSPIEFFDPEGLAAFERNAEQSRIGQDEVRFVRRDGTVLWTLLGWSPIFDNEGKPDGMLVMAMDVSARRLAESARRLGEAELRLLEKLALAASAAPDLSATFEAVLRLICETTGWSFGAAWVLVDDTTELVCCRTWTRSPEDGARFAPLVAHRTTIEEGILGRVWKSRTPLWVSDLASEPDSLRSGVAAELGIHAGLVVPVTTDTDVIAIIEFFMTEVRDVDTRFIKIVTTAALQLASVIARKSAESSLVERVRIATLTAEVGLALTKADPFDQVMRVCCEAIVRSLEVACVRIWTSRPGGKALELQASAGVFTDLVARETPVGRFEVGLVAERQRPELRNDLLPDLEIQEPDWARREGMTAFAGQPLLVGDVLVGVIALYSRNRMGQSMLDALAAISDAIAMGIHRNGVELANTALEAQLLQAQKMEAVGRLAGGIAHDFNNLLSVILSYGDMILGDLPPHDPMRGDMEEICRAGHRAADLTRQLLMFSRQQVVEPKVLDLNEVLAGLDKMLQRILGADVVLILSPAEQLGRIHVDRGSIEQVVMNLVVNARDAMPTGGRLTMKTANVSLDEDYARTHVGVKPGEFIMFSITDSGIGMDAATQTRIFEPFFTTKVKGKGTGLGLSTVFGIVQQCGGSVWVYSEPGHGTTFKVYIPRVDAMPDRDQPSETRASMRGTETILLVEDDEQVRMVARGILRRHGYTVIEAANAGEALLLCESADPIELLLSDVVMPQMSGPELAKRLAKSRPAMKLLCMSGYTDDSIVRHGVLEGDIDFLQKPFTPEALTRKVRESLDGG